MSRRKSTRKRFGIGRNSPSVERLGSTHLETRLEQGKASFMVLHYGTANRIASLSQAVAL